MIVAVPLEIAYLPVSTLVYDRKDNLVNISNIENFTITSHNNIYGITANTSRNSYHLKYEFCSREDAMAYIQRYYQVTEN